MPQESILDATLTVLPHISYWGFWAPTTPAITGPWFKPLNRYMIFLLFKNSLNYLPTLNLNL